MAARPSEPVAVIFNGTLPSQHTIEGTLEEVAVQVASSPPAATSILVVGRAAALRQHLRWFDARPLFGRRILVTTPREDALELIDLLAALGADAIEAPMLRFAPADDYGPLDDALSRIDTFAWIVFTHAERRRSPDVAAVGRHPGRCER